MADVYKAVDEVLGRTVAVKVMHAKYASDPAFATRFRQEAQAAGNLVSPNIVNMYDWGQDEDTYYIVMEYVRGTDLKSIIKEHGALDPRRVADIGAQVCAALSVAHGYDVIHRDIKPHNLMVQPDGAVKVMDFGIARAGNSTMTQTGSVLGTAHYVSPEQAQGKPLGMGSDLYSLGIVLYEASTGRLPFDADTPVAVALRQVNDEPRPPRTINPNIPPALEAIILKAMAKNPANRYASADEMRRDLLSVAAGGSPVVEGVSAGAFAANDTALMPPVGADNGYDSRARQGGARKPVIWPWILVALLLIGGGLGIAAYLGLFTSKPTVPSVIGLTQDNAESQIIAAGLTMGTPTETYDKTIPKGTVIKQTPSAGTKVDKGSAVDLVISKGIKKLIVPDVTKMTGTEAFTTLKDFGLDPVPGAEEFSKDVAQGSVIRQTPVAGTEVPEGSSVTYILSKGTELVQVPDVTGLGESSATRKLKAAGFRVSRRTDFSDATSKGRVMSQKPDGGGMIPKGSTVTITVAQGPITVTVPSVNGMTEAKARSTIEALGLLVSVTYKPLAGTDTVVDQTPVAGDKAKRGDTIAIVVGQL